MTIRWSVALSLVLTLAVATAATAAPGDITRLTTDKDGFDPDGPSIAPAISDDGSYVTFQSDATDLSPSVVDFNNDLDVFLREIGGFTRFISVNTDGDAPTGGNSAHPRIVEGDDPPSVIFESAADDLVMGDDGNWTDIFVRDLPTTTTRVSLDDGGDDPNLDSTEPDISTDGSVIAFTSNATDLFTPPPDDLNGTVDTYARISGANRLISLNYEGSAGGEEASRHPAVAGDSTAASSTIAFGSNANDIIDPDMNDPDVSDVFVHGLPADANAIVSVTSAGEQVGEPSVLPAISDDGGVVTFISTGALAPGGQAGSQGVFVRDGVEDTTERIDVTLDGSLSEGNTFPGTEQNIFIPPLPPPGDSIDPPSISGDGRYVAFSSGENSLVPNDTNSTQDVFVRDRQENRTIRVNVPAAGGQTTSRSASPEISGDGSTVAFASEDNGLVPGDTTPVNGFWEIFAVEVDWTRPDTSFATPPPASTTARQVGATLASSKSATTFECSLDGAAFAACAPSYTSPQLALGAHTLAARGTDRFGNVDNTPASSSFVVQQQQQQPQPTFRKDFNAQPVSGTVFVTLPNGTRVRLEDVINLPDGSIIDTRNGKVRLFVEEKNGEVKSAIFYDGLFRVNQLSNNITQLTLVGPLRGSASAAVAAAVEGRASAKRRRLWGNGKGRFRSKGKYSSATVRGTKWLVEDRKTSTLTVVKQGSVKVRDFVKKKTIVVKKGKRYVARKKKPRRG